jgi:hypothetical protein
MQQDKLGCSFPHEAGRNCCGLADRPTPIQASNQQNADATFLLQPGENAGFVADVDERTTRK